MFLAAELFWESQMSTQTTTLLDLGDMSGAVHTGVEVCRMDSEMSGLVERPWLQLMCCAICLLHGRNFRRRGVRVGVSAEWCVAVEHWRSSSIRDYLCRLSD